jgi:hypothetical protein
MPRHTIYVCIKLINEYNQYFIFNKLKCTVEAISVISFISSNYTACIYSIKYK